MLTEDVEPPELRVGIGDEGLDGGLLGHIERLRQGLAACFPDGGRGGFEGLGIPATDGDGGAFVGEADGDGAADALAAAGDDSCLILQER